mgnify:CR=1 FL=1
MKIKTLVAMLFLSAGATTVVAQDANCNSNSSISHEAVRAGNFKMRTCHGKQCWKIARHFVSILLRMDIKF